MHFAPPTVEKVDLIEKEVAVECLGCFRNMPVDLAFELGYLLGDMLGEEVEIVDYSFEPETGRLCVQARVGGREASGCVEVKACRGLAEESKWLRCVSKNLVGSEKLVRELADKLKS